MTAAGDRPRFCYVVLCHEEPDLTAALVRRVRELSTGEVLVRRDAGGVAPPLPSVFVSGVRARWGRWSLCLATVEALQEAVRRTGADWYVLVSGRDHPVVDLQAWEQDVAGLGVDALVAVDRRPGGLVRYGFRFREVPAVLARTVGRLPRPVRRALAVAWWQGVERSRLLRLWRWGDDGPWALGVRRHRPSDLVRSSQWTTLSAAAVEALVAAAGDPRTARWFAGTFVPDEVLVGTVLARAGLRTADRPTSWARFEPGDLHPSPAGPSDVDAARAAGAAFVRKTSPTDPGATSYADGVVGPGSGARSSPTASSRASIASSTSRGTRPVAP